jgi:hypothetical protein
MGTIEGGVLGGFNGKVGAVIGSHWKGKAVMRGKSTAKRAKSSALQLEQQAKFTLMVNFLQAIVDFLNISYKKAAIQMSGFNKAISANIQFAVTGTYPDFTVDYAKVQLSKGSLPVVPTPAAASTVAGKLTFTWTDNSKITTGALSSDIPYVAAYNEEQKHWILNDDAATRSAGTFVLDVTGYSGKPLQTYMGLMSADGKKTSATIYTGVVNVL